jgi:hypothetical protein
LSPVDGRLRASEIISARPDASLREIARDANVSISTAREVRQRARRGEDPVPGRSAPADARPSRPRTPTAPVAGGASALETPRADPSLRFTDVGRTLLQWMGVYAIGDQPGRVADSIPEHCVETMVELAHRCAEAWTRLGNDLGKRVQNAVGLGDQRSAN